MKSKLTLLAFMVLGLQIVFSQTLVNNGGEIIVVNGTALVIEGDFLNLDDGNILNSGTVVITGDWTNDATSGNLLQGTSGEVKFNGPSAQTIQGTTQTWFNKLTLETDVSLASQISVGDELMFDQASVYLGGSNLYLEPAAQFAGVDPSTSFVVTEQDGSLVREVGSSPVLFPVGNSGSYTPATLKNDINPKDFEVRVFSDVLKNGISGGTIPEIEDCVNKTWVVSDPTIGISDLEVTVQWNSTDEGSTFNRNRSALGFNDNSWSPDPESAAAGTGPFTQHRAGLSDGGSFAVGDVESPMATPTIISLEADLMVYLEGPYNGTDMDTHLNGNPELVEGLPLSQPYNTAPWHYNGTESVPSIPNPDVVDWLLIDFRDAVDAANATDATTFKRQVAFLLRDGSVVDLDGSSNLQLNNSITQQLFVVIRHRNHIDIISANPLTDAGGVYSYNYTMSIDKVYGGAAGYKDIASGVYGMAGGDGNADGSVDGTDKMIWSAKSGEAGYLAEDQNMDGQVNNPDKNDIWILNNNNKTSQVPE
jgi:hypothetical protein